MEFRSILHTLNQFLAKMLQVICLIQNPCILYNDHRKSYYFVQMEKLVRLIIIWNKLKENANFVTILKHKECHYKYHKKPKTSKNIKTQNKKKV